LNGGRPLFAYGTLALPSVLEALLARPVGGVPATLMGWKRYRVQGALYPAVVAAPGASTPGVLYLGLAADEISLLDRFEGALYVRRTLEISAERGRRGAQVYVLAPGSEDALTRDAWELREFAERHADRYVAACRDSRAVAAATATDAEVAGDAGLGSH
jgi:gamma-glutamylcyclotransferase (GGCT)/AIG2-like uncharacterized protein YtfP